MNKVVYIPAYFEPVGKNKTVKVPTGEKKKGFFGGEKYVTKKETQWEQTGWSDCRIDGERLANDLAEVVDGLNSEGYEVVSVTPVTSGAYDWKYQVQSGGAADNGYGGYGYGYGYSFTNSLIVTAKKSA
ncbi:hypothetical protein HNO53_06125 [Billgrantia antri]|uniref:Uncharacterized protein n=1 Tax=Halomonas sulfidivorans TaxID=2733488 RepID=A0ABX7WDW7_9GAMM|nr:hypothetical protein [Halomonas sulfidivorans]QTP58325.1 hypothetical protein HNO53_06125 [Halomonas sulfidivorans]